MKFLIAVDSFKGTLTSVRAADIIAAKFREFGHSAAVLPVADGGEGTIDALKSNGSIKIISVTAPDSTKTDARYLIIRDTAVIESAEAIGLCLREKKRPLSATTYGLGEIIKDALNGGIRRIIIGLGGSATTDAGTGALAALGFKFFDKEGKSFIPVGGSLSEISAVSADGADTRIREAETELLCDVTNPPYGESGAAYVFAPQKGATAEETAILDDGLRNITEIYGKFNNKDYSNLIGGGAAGGLGLGLHAMLGAKIVSGANKILELNGFEEMLASYDAVITGEGSFDSQSLMGKITGKIISISKKAEKPVYIIAGTTSFKKGDCKNEISGLVISNPLKLPMEEVKRNAAEMLEKAAEELCKLISFSS